MTDSIAPPVSSTDALTTLFALGREVTSVLDLNELLRKIPQLIARLTKFHAFAVYLLDPAKLTQSARTLKLTLGLLIALLVLAIGIGSWLIVADLNRQLTLARQKPPRKGRPPSNRGSPSLFRLHRRQLRFPAEHRAAAEFRRDCAFIRDEGVQ